MPTPQSQLSVREERPDSQAQARQEATFVPRSPQLQPFAPAEPTIRSVMHDVNEEPQVPRQRYPQAFRRARPISQASEKFREGQRRLHEECQQIQREYEAGLASLAARDYRVSQQAIARQEIPVTVDNDLDDATFVSHMDWQQRFEKAELRRKEQQGAVQPEETHSTGILETLKNWATGVWTTIKGFWY